MLSIIPSEYPYLKYHLETSFVFVPTQLVLVLDDIALEENIRTTLEGCREQITQKLKGITHETKSQKQNQSR